MWRRIRSSDMFVGSSSWVRIWTQVMLEKLLGDVDDSEGFSEEMEWIYAEY
jgi:hypothetical protein